MKTMLFKMTDDDQELIRRLQERHGVGDATNTLRTALRIALAAQTVTSDRVVREALGTSLPDPDASSLRPKRLAAPSTPPAQLAHVKPITTKRKRIVGWGQDGQPVWR